MDVWTLFVTASIPILETFLIIALGSYLALDRVNLLGPDCRNYLNTILFYVCTPALIAANLAETITYESVVKLWFMPVNILLTYIIGSIFGWIILKLTGAPPHLRGLLVGCCAAGNHGNLLLIIIQQFVKNQGVLLEMLILVILLALLMLLYHWRYIGAIYLWTYVYNIVRISAKTSIQDSTQSNITEISSAISHTTSYNETLLSIEDNAINQSGLPGSESQREVKMSRVGKIKEWMVKIIEKLNLKTVFTPSTIATIIGSAIGIISPVRNFLIGDDAPLAVIDDATSLLGEGAIPLLTLLIGANLVKGLKVGGIQKSVLIGIIIAKYVAGPLTGVLIVKAAIKFGFVSNDPLYLFVLLLQYAVPPAMNLGTMTQLFGQGQSECSVIMLWTYIFASIALTFWSAFFLWLVG